MQLGRWDTVAVLVLLGAAGAGLAVLPDLPASFAIHFGPDGAPDSVVDPTVGVLLTPAIGVATVAFVRLALRADPPGDPRVGPVVVVWTALFIAAVQALLLAWNLGYDVAVDLAVAGLVAAAVGLTGLLLYLEGWS